MTETTTCPSPPLDRARHLLAGLLAAGSRPGEDVIAVANALAVLDDVTPPHPPLLAVEPCVGWGSSVTDALGHLRQAIAQARDMQELVRIASGALELRQVPR